MDKSSLNLYKSQVIYRMEFFLRFAQPEVEQRFGQHISYYSWHFKLLVFSINLLFIVYNFVLLPKREKEDFDDLASIVSLFFNILMLLTFKSCILRLSHLPAQMQHIWHNCLP